MLSILCKNNIKLNDLICLMKQNNYFGLNLIFYQQIKIIFLKVRRL